jgi:hypothetical protein
MPLHRNWTGPFSRQKQRRASEHGRAMARVRWQRDRERREKVAQLTAEKYPQRIVRRIVVIDRERTAREVVIWSWDSAREARRKIREVLRGESRK